MKYCCIAELLGFLILFVVGVVVCLFLVLYNFLSKIVGTLPMFFTESVCQREPNMQNDSGISRGENEVLSICFHFFLLHA